MVSVGESSVRHLGTVSLRTPMRVPLPEFKINAFLKTPSLPSIVILLYPVVVESQ